MGVLLQRRAVQLLLLLGVCTAPLAGFHLTSPSLQLRRPCTLTRRVAAPRLTTGQRERIHAQLDEHENDRGRKGSSSNGLLTGGSALAASALIFEALQVAGTALVFVIAQHYTGTNSPAEVVGVLVDHLQSLGDPGYAVFAALMVFLQVIPIAAAFVLTVSAGAIFGIAKGVAVVLTCSTISATISFVLARTFGRSIVLQAARESPTYQTLDKAFSEAGFGTAFTLILLLRLSPILPFSWANYVFGLSGVPWAAFSLGTFFGCLPAVAAYVASGNLGAEIAVDGGETNPLLLVVGIVATIGAVTIAGNVAGDALKAQGLDLDLESEGKQALFDVDSVDSVDNI